MLAGVTSTGHQVARFTGLWSPLASISQAELANSPGQAW